MNISLIDNIDTCDADLFSEYKKTGSHSIRDKIVEKYIHIPHSIAKRYAFKGIEYDDLYQAACIGLLHAIDNFDASFNNKFSTYATACVLGEVKHLFRKCGNYIKVPRRVYELYYKIKKLTQSALTDSDIELNTQEIAKRLSVSEDEVKVALTWGNNRIAKSLDQFMHEGEEMVYSDVLGLEDSSLLLLEDKMFLDNCFKNLTEDEKTFLKYRYYDEMSQAEIAKRMNVSQMKISRMEKKVLTSLKEMYAR
ncbi:MAG: sigma-70 family RNA polymerase sigma factor [Clostridia bacterium]|nr:sigma-70 family RNA polymerase sigma factor [Clostridia bacterium]